MLQFRNANSKTLPDADAVRKELGAYNLRPFPTVVNRLLAALKDPKSNAQTFSDIIEVDAAISTRLLRMVNSPIYGFQNEVRSVKQAIALLGQKPVKKLALAYAGSTIMGPGVKHPAGEALWSHSLACATVARILAGRVNAAMSDDAFVAGIFHDVGKLFFLDKFPDHFSELARGIGSENGGLQQESDLFGISHAEAGLRLTVLMPLPDKIKGAIRYHHQPELDLESNMLAAIIHVANGIAHSAGIGGDSVHGYPVADAAKSLFELSEQDVFSIQEESRLAFVEIRRAFADS